MDQVEHSYRLLTNGWLPGWLGLLVAAAAGALVVWQHRREFANSRPSRLTRRILPALRLLVVALFVWLLCRPEFMRTTRWQEKPILLLMPDHGAGMEVAESFRGLYEKLDVLGYLRLQPLETSNRACSRLARTADALDRKLIASRELFRSTQDRFADGLPPVSDFAARLDRLGTDLDTSYAALQAALDELPREQADPELAKELEAFSRKAVILATLVKNQGQELPLFKKTVAAHPETLELFSRKLDEAAVAAREIREAGGILQDKLDAVLLDGKRLEAVRTLRVSRRALAEQVAQNFKASLSDRYQVVIPPEPGADQEGAAGAVLGALFEHHLNGSLAGAVFLSDGCATWGKADLDRLALLHGIPVDTVLIGRDGVAPEDAGLVALDVPAVAVAGVPFFVRGLVLNNLPSNADAKLTVTRDNRVLAAVALPATSAVPSTVEVPVTLEQTGRHRLTIEAGNGKPDAFPGNERVDCTVDVLAESLKILMVSGGVGADVAGYRGTLEGLGFGSVETLAVEPGMSPLTTGPDSGAFPALREQWSRVHLVILLGRVPPELPDTALAGLKEAVAAGLQVFVQSAAPEPADAAAARSWPDVLGLSVAPEPSSGRLRPPPDQWLDAYEVGADPADSRRRLAALPALDGLVTAADPGLALLRSEKGDIVKLVPRGRGMILFAGIPQPALLRQGGNAQTVNRLMAGLLALALRPVTPADVAGTGFPRIIQPRNRADFALTPSAATLAALAHTAGGRALELYDLETDQLPKRWPAPQPVRRSETRLYPLWTGVWPLFLLLGLVTAEYLLRRRAGRVM
jgi:hypothetical protein